VRSILCLLVLPASLILASAYVVLLLLLRAPAKWIDRVYTGFAEFCLLVAGTRLEVRGLEHVEPRQPYVVVANHESSWDPVVLLVALKAHPVRFVVKQEIMRTPILGRALLHSGNVCVLRTNTAGDAERIGDEMKRRRADVSILFYAEGTRARDGAFHPFKKGAFVTAVSQGLPILPVATAGTYWILPPLSLRIRPGTVVVEVGAPIATAGSSPDDRDRLRDRTHAVVGDLRARARARLRAAGCEPGGAD
jgi:1-acyl-sn-glycerol-3-phosphate acyltransferase